MQPDYSGIRTKSENDDFEIVISAKNQSGSLINLLGIDSPGLTSSIPIGEYVKCIDLNFELSLDLILNFYYFNEYNFFNYIKF